jgi:hypothetical protein
MDHVAIMKKSLGLLPKIRSGLKTIESRWYTSKRAPWGKIEYGDTVYFKDSGEPVTMKATVAKVISIADLTPKKIGQLFERHGNAIGVQDELPSFIERHMDKRYCLLIFFEKPEPIIPFHIDKTGFGMMSAWITVNDIRSIQKTNPG